MRITTVVLAGGPPDAVAAHTEGAANKAFIDIAGLPLVTRTLEALRATPSVGRIIVVAPPQTHAAPALAPADECRADGAKIRASLENGLRGLPPDQSVLVSTSDLPILTTAAIADFIARASATNADLTYGCLEKRTHLARFPEVPHTWARLHDGTYCGGGFVTIKPRIFPALAAFIERLGHARKNPLQLASLFGWDVLLRFALRQLTIADAERRASQLLGASVRAVVSPYAETAVNVDRVSDIALAEKLIAAANASD
ncbi:MAG TPA: NTP transferase domain-containing protein [Candidatus Baltobacteraceae bacterium]